MIDDEHLLNTGSTIREALAKLNSLGSFLTLFVIDADRRIKGTVTDGDIRRAMLRGATIDEKIEPVMNTKFTFLKVGHVTLDDVRVIKEKHLKLIPIVNDQDQIVRIINFEKVRTVLPIDAVIMAGGEGRRLRPLTDHTPKPMLKIGEKPIIEHNVDRLCEYGVENCYITIKYLGDQIRDYFGNGKSKEMNIAYVEENGDPLGTIGSVSLIQSFVHDSVLVMNSDLLTNIDYEDFFLEFKKSGADMAVATIPYSVTIPYAVLETENDRITGFKEKPTFTYYSNAGIYFIKRNVLSLIPKGQHHNATDLMDFLIGNNRKVMTYPLHCYWLDIGKHEDFQKAQQDIQHIKF